MPPRILVLLVLVLLAAEPGPASAADKPKKAGPSQSELGKLVKEYLAADEGGRRQIREQCDAQYATLKPGGTLKNLRRNALKAAKKAGPRIEDSGTHFLYEDEEDGRYIVQGSGKGLFVGLHGGGQGRARAEGATRLKSIGDCLFIAPQVIDDGGRSSWTSPASEKFVMDLIDAAKCSQKIDPDRVYLTGTSMGGFGTWALCCHHADVFASAASFAGGPGVYAGGDGEMTPAPGYFWNLYNLPFSFYHSLDDPTVSPDAEIFAAKELARLQQEYPGGFEFRYDEQDGQGHGRPKDGVKPAHEWAYAHQRNARPEKVFWQPVLDWKRHFYWLYWQEPKAGTLLRAELVGKNEIHLDVLEGASDLTGFSVLLGDPLVDLRKDVVLVVSGEERFRGKVESSLSTILLTLPRFDEELLFDARIDL